MDKIPHERRSLKGRRITDQNDEVLVPPGKESPAYIHPGTVERFDAHGPVLPGHEQSGETEYRLIGEDEYHLALDSEYHLLVSEVDNVMKAQGFLQELRERLWRILDYAFPHRRFARGPEAKQVAEILDSFLGTDRRLFDLLRQAEKGGRLHPGTADHLEAAYRMDNNPFLHVAKQIQRELKLIPLAPEFRNPRAGRPNFFMQALVANAIANEIQGRSPKEFWPVVAKVLTPFIKEVRPPIFSDPEHLRQLVVSHKRAAKRKADAGEGESWSQSLARLYQDVGLDPPATTQP